MIRQLPSIPDPPSSGDLFSETSVLQSDMIKSFSLPASTMPDEITTATLCQANCSGNGECREGSCYCMVITHITFLVKWFCFA